nr:SA1362 family protein [uncultured Bacillus sp.]
MKNRVLTYVVVGLIIFAVIGAFSNLISNPIAILKGLAIMAVITAVIYFFVIRFYKPNPEKREQRAFVKAAKRSTKRLKANKPIAKTKHHSVTSFKKLKIRRKSDANPNLTVIEGRKGKKKNRASF